MEINTGTSGRCAPGSCSSSRSCSPTPNVLYLKTHSFHQNVEGPMFQTLHQMFKGNTPKPERHRPIAMSASAWASTRRAPTASTRPDAHPGEKSVPRAEAW